MSETANLLGMPHGRAQTALYWGCPTIELTGIWRKNLYCREHEDEQLQTTLHRAKSLRRNHTRFCRTKIQSCLRYEQLSYLLVIIPPPGEHCGSPKYSFHHCECSLCLRTILKNLFILKTMILYQLKHAKHLLS